MLLKSFTPCSPVIYSSHQSVVNIEYRLYVPVVCDLKVYSTIRSNLYVAMSRLDRCLFLSDLDLLYFLFFRSLLQAVRSLSKFACTIFILSIGPSFHGNIISSLFLSVEHPLDVAVSFYFQKATRLQLVIYNSPTNGYYCTALLDSHDWKQREQGGVYDVQRQFGVL